MKIAHPIGDTDAARRRCPPAKAGSNGAASLIFVIDDIGDGAANTTQAAERHGHQPGAEQVLRGLDAVAASTIAAGVDRGKFNAEEH